MSKQEENPTSLNLLLKHKSIIEIKMEETKIAVPPVLVWESLI